MAIFLSSGFYGFVTSVTKTAEEYAEHFLAGFSGYGWRIWEHTTGKYKLEIDDVKIRGTLTVYEMLIEKIRSVRGSLGITQASGKIKEAASDGTNYYIAIEEEMSFMANDIIRCQAVSSGASKEYWVTISSIKDNLITIPKAEFTAGMGVPSAGDEIVQFGNTIDTTRQSAIFLSTNSGKPSIDIMFGINKKSFDGCVKLRLGSGLDGESDVYNGLFCENGLIKSVNSAGEEMYKFRPDGSGFVAKGAISWGTDGKVKLSQNVTIEWVSSAFGELSQAVNDVNDLTVKLVGNSIYRNLIPNSDNIKNIKYTQHGISVEGNPDEYDILDADGSNKAMQFASGADIYTDFFRVGVAATGSDIHLTPDITYTASVYIKPISGIGKVKLVLGDVFSDEITLVSGEWQRVSFTSKFGLKPDWKFMDVRPCSRGDILQIYHPQIELGDVVTDYTVAAVDKLTKIDSNGIYTGTLSADQVNAIEINAGSIKVGTLSVDRLDLKALTTQIITAENINAIEINADSIKAGTISVERLNLIELKTQIVTANNINALELNSTKGKIAGWNIYSEFIQRESATEGHNVRLSSNGYFYNCDSTTGVDFWALHENGGATFGTGTTAFSPDGSGYLANSNIVWDKAGNVQMIGKITASSGSIGGWLIGESDITGTNGTNITSISSAGELFNQGISGITNYWRLNTDGSAEFSQGNVKFNKNGSGSLANGNISWTSLGQLNLQNCSIGLSGVNGAIKISAENMDTLENLLGASSSLSGVAIDTGLVSVSSIEYDSSSLISNIYQYDVSEFDISKETFDLEIDLRQIKLTVNAHGARTQASASVDVYRYDIISSSYLLISSFASISVVSSSIMAYIPNIADYQTVFGTANSGAVLQKISGLSAGKYKIAINLSCRFLAVADGDEDVSTGGLTLYRQFAKYSIVPQVAKTIIGSNGMCCIRDPRTYFYMDSSAIKMKRKEAAVELSDDGLKLSGLSALTIKPTIYTYSSSIPKYTVYYPGIYWLNGTSDGAFNIYYGGDNLVHGATWVIRPFFKGTNRTITVRIVGSNGLTVSGKMYDDNTLNDTFILTSGEMAIMTYISSEFSGDGLSTFNFNKITVGP